MFNSKPLIGIGLVGFVCALLAACAGMRQAPTGFVVPGATWEVVSREGMVFGEGVVASPNGIVYFSSMTRALPTTNLGFGRGADAGSLYVITAFPMRLYRIKTVREGHYF